MKISDYFGYIGAYSVVFALLLGPVITLVIGKHFDKKYKNIYNPVARLGPASSYARGIQYARLIFFGKHFQNVYWKTVFGKYDFRKEARWIDKILAALFSLSLLFGIACMVISFSLSIFGY